MAKYKANETYLELEDKDNFNAFFSPNKHKILIEGGCVELSNIPKSLVKHLTLQGELKQDSDDLKVEESVSPQKSKKNKNKENK